MVFYFSSSIWCKIEVSILVILFYLFATLSFLAGIIYVLALVGCPLEIIKSNLSESILITQICLTSTMIYYLLKRYSGYLLSIDWRKNFFSFLRIGLKWSLPLLVIHIISFSVPIIRDKLIENYLSMKVISVRGIANFSLILFSIDSICEYSWDTVLERDVSHVIQF